MIPESAKSMTPPVPATILLVDDELSLLDVLGTALADAGYHCMKASAAASALRHLEQSPEIDVVVSDIRMPGMDGLALLEIIRERFADRNWLQVLFMTGHASVSNAVAALRLNAVDFLYKPVRRAEFLESVARAASKASAQRIALDVWHEGRTQLERLSEDARRLTEMLTSFPTVNTAGSPVAYSAVPRQEKHTPAEPPSPERLLELLHTKDIRSRYFTDKLFADPAWHMLLDLMENKLLGKSVSVSSLYIASGVPGSTASRRLGDLEEAGLVYKWDDPRDGRRQYAELTQKAVELLNAYLHTLDRQLR